jgi:hypothetical protein
VKRIELYMRIADGAARKHAGAKNLPRHMVEDLRQEGVTWLLEHPNRVEHSIRRDGNVSFGQLVSEMRKHFHESGVDRPPGEVVRRQHVEPKYTPGLVARAFPGVFDPDYIPVDAPDQGDWMVERQDAVERWRALVADVDRAVTAYGRYSANIRMVFRLEGLGDTYRSVAADEGIGVATLNRRHTEVLEWLTDWLNGLDPNRERKDEMPRRWEEWDTKRPTGHEMADSE